ncbi:hypothetical protein ABK040_000890 [Willaertia magna]
MNNNEYSLNNSNNRNVYYPSVSATNNTQDEQDEEIIETTQEMELAQEMNDLNNNATTTTRGLSSSFTKTITPTKKWIHIIYNFLNYFTYLISLLAIINCFLYGALILAEFGFNAEGRNTLLEKGVIFFVFLIVALISLMRGIIGFIVPKNNFSFRTNIILDICLFILLIIEVIVQISLFVGPDNFPPSFGLAGYIVYFYFKNNIILVFGLPIKDIQTFFEFTLILTIDGTVYVIPHTSSYFPTNQFLQFWEGIDLNKEIDCFEFTKTDPIESIYIKIGSLCAFLNKKGEVYMSCADKRFNGKLDQKLLENKKIIKVVTGMNHALFLTNDGCVFSLGPNFYSCGDHSTGANAQPLNFNRIVNEFQLVDCNNKLVKQLHGGFFNGAFKTEDDRYQIFGSNHHYQFTDNFTKDKLDGVVDFGFEKFRN